MELTSGDITGVEGLVVVSIGEVPVGSGERHTVESGENQRSIARLYYITTKKPN